MIDHLSMLSKFALVMGMTLLLPKLMERFRLPGVLGFIAAGMVVGPPLLGMIDHDSKIISLFSELGKLLFMFFVGFEIDLELFKKNRNRAAVFGLFTFAMPFMAGVALGLALGYSVNAAVLIGSIIASHTLLAYPILQKLGLTHNAAVSVTVSGTIFTDIASMLVLAVAVSVHQTGFSWNFLLSELVELALFVPLILFGLSRLTRMAIIRYGGTPEARVTILLVALALAAEGASFIKLEGIVGAFLVGLALKRTLRGRFAIEQLEVVAHSLFIPAFFLATGFLVDFAVMKGTLLGQPLLVIGLIAGTIGGKSLAAWITGKIYHFEPAETRTMATLSYPQMAATLASAVVGYQALNSKGERLLSNEFVNAVLILVIVTCVLGPIMTAHFASPLSSKAKGASKNSNPTPHES